jgi:hypothetical protein
MLANVLRGRVNLYVSCVILFLGGCLRVGLVRSLFGVWLREYLNFSCYLWNKLELIITYTFYIIKSIVLILHVIN